MRISRITIVLILLCVLSCKNDKKQELKPVEVIENVSLLDTLQLKLDGQDKWLVNLETQEGVNKMDSIITAFSAKTDKDFVSLGETLSKQTSYIIKNCTMKGEPHDQLHVVLVPMLDVISVLRETDNQVEAEKALTSLKSLIKDYYNYFKL